MKKRMVLVFFSLLLFFGCSTHTRRHYYREGIRLQLYIDKVISDDTIYFTAILSGDSSMPEYYECLIQAWEFGRESPRIIEPNCQAENRRRSLERRGRRTGKGYGYEWYIYERFSLTHRFHHRGKHRVRLVLYDDFDQVMVRSNRVIVRIR